MAFTQVTDRELLVAIFNAITRLAEKLTGEKIVVFVSTGAGDLPYCGVPVAWLPIHRQGVTEVLDGLRQFEHSATLPAPRREPHDIPQEHC